MARTKDLIHNKKGCGQIYEIKYNDDNLPYLVCEGCGHHIEDWIKWEKEYSLYWKDDDKWNQKQHHLVVLLGYFCAKFQECYSYAYSLSLNEKGLFRGQEINVLRRIYTGLQSNPYFVRKYIDWYFLEKIKNRRKRLTSISVLAAPTLINEFKWVSKKATLITRDKRLPQGMQKWIDDFAPDVRSHVDLQDYGDLKLFLQHIKGGYLKEVEQVSLFVDQLKTKGVINEEYAIKNWSE